MRKEKNKEATGEYRYEMVSGWAELWKRDKVMKKRLGKSNWENSVLDWCILYHCHSKYHEVSGFQQYKFIILQFSKLESYMTSLG
jgi:hypothetical protein